MSKQRVTGIIVGLAGLLVTMGHFILQALNNVPERYHGHTSWVAVGVILMLVGFFMLTAGKGR